MTYLKLMRMLGDALGHGWAEIGWEWDDVRLEPEDAVAAARLFQNVYNASGRRCGPPAGAALNFRVEFGSVVYESSGGRIYAQFYGAGCSITVRTSRGDWSMLVDEDGESYVPSHNRELLDDPWYAERVLCLEALLPGDLRERARRAVEESQALAREIGESQ